MGPVIRTPPSNGIENTDLRRWWGKSPGPWTSPDGLQHDLPHTYIAILVLHRRRAGCFEVKEAAPSSTPQSMWRSRKSGLKAEYGYIVKTASWWHVFRLIRCAILLELAYWMQAVIPGLSRLSWGIPKPRRARFTPEHWVRKLCLIWIISMNTYGHNASSKTSIGHRLTSYIEYVRNFFAMGYILYK